MKSWSYVPSLLWLVDYKSNIDTYLDYIALAGMTLSGLVMVMGGANCVVMAVLWMLYHSIVNVGQRWYSFGWESQLLETGFLAIFLCPVYSINPVPRGTPVSRVAIWAYRWLIFRIMLGAGLIKIRGDKCWRDLTCMNYHYETQPVPNPLSYYLHQSPEIFHKFETLTNHFVELVAPFLLVLPRRFMIAGGVIQILFQVVLIISGNLSFLNWLTMLPSLACFDDVSLSWMFSTKRGSAHWRVTEIQMAHKLGKAPPLTLGNYVRRVYNICLGCTLVYLSLPVVQNLLSSRQAMNTSFDSLRIVNTYGAFGSITKERTEVIFEGTYSSDPYSPQAVWQEYQFKCKPGNITRRPCIISPYHYRLDWLMWFAAFQNFQYNPWLVHLAVKLLANEPTATSLIDYNPFQGKPPPKFIRAEHYQYRYTRIGSKAATKGQWWRRKRIGNYLPPVSLQSAQPIVKQMGWKLPEIQDS
ncbi:lipase maturation factor 1-like [Liolophura sinensis]|uniref:lipase maturation factor 1-like n=1 Tax=Liolophura sinensis TaxID=3198878 RepID=UPI003158CA1B